MYFRSVYTGACVYSPTLPKFGGWELIAEAEYMAWCRTHGIAK